MIRESNKMNMVVTSIGLVVLGLLMFMVGRISNHTITDTSTKSEVMSYTIESSYISDEIDFELEAKYIKSNSKSSMSVSKIKHILIYIEGMCEHYDLNYNLVKSVISTESNWNYRAKSRVGALGLMQIMKACATDYKTPHREMYDPYVNVTIGIKYLSKLTKRFGDTPTALVGYNEGPRNASKYSFDYINDAKYVHKVMGYLLDFEPYDEVAVN
jgi:hypothetical protein